MKEDTIMVSQLKSIKEELAEVIIRFGVNDKRVINDRELWEAIDLAVGLTKTLEDIEPRLKEQKELIAQKAMVFIGDKRTVTFVVDLETWGHVECKVSFRHEAIIPDNRVETLRGILGSRFDDLVRVKTTYYAMPKLIELTTYGDRGKEIAKCIVVKERAPQISFK